MSVSRCIWLCSILALLSSPAISANTTQRVTCDPKATVEKTCTADFKTCSKGTIEAAMGVDDFTDYWDIGPSSAKYTAISNDVDKQVMLCGSDWKKSKSGQSTLECKMSRNGNIVTMLFRKTGSWDAADNIMEIELSSGRYRETKRFVSEGKSKEDTITGECNVGKPR